MSTPYAVSSDLVSAWPAKSLAVAQFVDAYKTTLNMTQNAQTGTSFTFAATDFTKLVTLSNASAVAVTVPKETTVAWETGTQLRLLNIGAGLVTVSGAVGVTINGTPLTLAQWKGANLIKTGTDTWVFVPFASGGAAAVVGSTTGSPTITTDGTATIYKFTGDGTMVISSAGLATLLLVGPGGGGGGGGNGGGGGGGAVVAPGQVLLDVGTLTIKVGAGAAAGDPGTIGGVTMATTLNTNAIGGGGGGGGTTSRTGLIGATTGGASGANSAQAVRYGTLGYQGGNGAASVGGGGGGAGAVGANGVASTSAGAGGAGVASSITGTSVTYGGGGGGGATTGSAGAGGSGGGGAGSASAAAATAGTANTGGGGGGNGTGSAGAGGSGVFIVRVG